MSLVATGRPCRPYARRHGQSHPHLHPHRRRRHDRARRHEPYAQDRHQDRRVRRHQRGQRGHRRRPGARRSGRGRVSRPGPRAERPLRRGRGPGHPRGARPEVPPAAGRAVLRGPPGGRLRQLPRRAGEAAQLHPARRHRGGGAAAPGLYGRAPRRALHVGGARRARRRHEPADGHVSQPALGPAVHPGEDGEQGPRRRAVGAGREPLTAGRGRGPLRPR
ncbi:ATP:Cob(I)alamin adenosyltransferase [Actinacidiphila bryophytorum]|uniref:ATP:Cob(I)alamin adenosyltransferase n=1 Tax=Actinacidiphila bryophytorum TaxID=1436133 RepID=A0A9W4E043_9ACTN|nr:ATP:Cob(I)alamin adenosyltransferase [Actinacidiphila bryophytorum]